MPKVELSTVLKTLDELIDISPDVADKNAIINAQIYLKNVLG